MTKDEFQQELGNCIKKIRSLKGWSQSDLARACDKDRQAIEKIENGKVNPTAFTLHQIAKALKTSFAKFLEF